MTQNEWIFAGTVIAIAFLYGILKPVKPKKRTIIELENERRSWSLKTFPEATSISSLRKLESEIKEVEELIMFWEGTEPRDPIEYKAKFEQLKEEYADCLKCLFDSAGRRGIYPQDIFDAFEIKLEKNKARKWIKNKDNSYSHVK